MKTMPVTIVAVGLLAAASSVPAANIDNGRKLVEKNCTKCHNERVYTRPDHHVTSLAGLKKQVTHCQQSLGLQWFNEDIDDVAAYLNQSYYHFK